MFILANGSVHVTEKRMLHTATSCSIESPHESKEENMPVYEEKDCEGHAIVTKRGAHHHDPAQEAWFEQTDGEPSHDFYPKLLDSCLSS